MPLVQQLLSVVFVIALAGAAVWALRRKGLAAPLFSRSRKPGPAAEFQNKGRMMLTPQHALHVIHFGGRELLVATHPQGCSLLSEKLAEKSGNSTGAAA